MKNLTVTKLLTYLFIIVAILLLSITFAYYFFNKNHSEQENSIDDNYTLSTPISQDESPVSDEKFTIYTVKELDGVIAVFENDEKIDIMLDTVLVSSLPKDDRELIENGVKFESYQELIAFLEDFE